MSIYNPYTNTNDQPVITDFPNWASQNNVLRQQAKQDFNNAWIGWILKYKIPQSILDEWSAKAIEFANASEATKLNFWQKAKEKYQTVVKDVKEKVTDVKEKVNDIKTNNPITNALHSPGKATKIKDILDKAKEKAYLALFAPLTALAIVFLRRRGITPAKTAKGLILQVNAETSKKSFGLSSDVIVDLFDFGPVESNYGLTGPAADSSELPINPGVIINTVKFLKEIFEALKKKKDSGVPLSVDEQKILDMAPEITQALIQAPGKAEALAAAGDIEAVEEASKPEGGFMLLGMFVNFKVLIGILLLIALLWFFVFKK